LFYSQKYFAEGLQILIESIKANLVLNKKTYTVAAAKLCKIISHDGNTSKIATRSKAIEYLRIIFDFLKERNIQLDDDTIKEISMNMCQQIIKVEQPKLFKNKGSTAKRNFLTLED
jgi:hypothetical protein